MRKRRTLGGSSTKSRLSLGKEVDSCCIIAVRLISIQKFLLIVMLQSLWHRWDLLIHKPCVSSKRWDVIHNIYTTARWNKTAESGCSLTFKTKLFSKLIKPCIYWGIYICIYKFKDEEKIIFVFRRVQNCYTVAGLVLSFSTYRRTNLSSWAVSECLPSGLPSLLGAFSTSVITCTTPATYSWFILPRMPSCCTVPTLILRNTASLCGSEHFDPLGVLPWHQV